MQIVGAEPTPSTSYNQLGDFIPLNMKKSIALFLLAVISMPAMASASSSIDDPKALRAKLEAMSPFEMDEVLWLARCIYSESNLTHEQKHIAWVVRNRVETNYRGASYREVVLEPLQFSIFNTPSTRRKYILGLNQNSDAGHWLKALDIALKVYQADPQDRPFSIETRHFYSPISMKNNRVPDWAKNIDPLNSEQFDIDPNRFLFFEEIDDAGDPFLALKTPGDHIESFQTETRERLQPTQAGKPSLRERWKPSGRVARPARPSTRSAKGKQRTGW